MHHETDAMVAAKAKAVIRAGLVPIICLGESLAERDAGQTVAVVSSQLAGSVPEEAGTAVIVIAYEPVWAIGTGRTPTSAQVGEVHAMLGKGLERRFGAAGKGVRLLYGGSVKPDNARELMAVNGVDGALVGGASLKSADFLAIARACG
jgi:triosephosphate isomerase